MKNNLSLQGLLQKLKISVKFIVSVSENFYFVSNLQKIATITEELLLIIVMYSCPIIILDHNISYLKHTISL